MFRINSITHFLEFESCMASMCRDDTPKIIVVLSDSTLFQQELKLT
jgi:hypothetical protein